MHAADWEHFPTVDDPDDFAAWRAMGRLADAALLNTDPDDRTIVPGVRVVHTPGHTPGHRSVLVDAGVTGTLLLAGDLLHLPVQVAHPEWPSDHDEDPELGARSREAMLVRARGEAWHVAVSHFARPLGRVVADGDGQRWA